ncbi:MAG: SelB C-terminal domain-containing protein [Nocardioidaceae bacterium]
MHVIATAGHVDHGKSTLVHALTGQDPDRLDEEHRRGLSIELGYCWTQLAPRQEVAFVDVPGHERFVSTMLAGVGPVPAVMFVVAADDPWMPQAAEHLAALDALGVEHGVLVVTRSDLADPGPAIRCAQTEFALTTLAGVPAVAVSAITGEGMDELRRQLVTLIEGLPKADAEADVRLWVDRAFQVSGAGTVVTGTLTAGRIRVGDVLHIEGTPVRVRRIQTLGRDVAEAQGVSRVALRLGAGMSGLVRRRPALVTAGSWWSTSEVDVRVVCGPTEGPAGSLVLHIGASSVGVRCRPLDPGHEALARLMLERALPLRVGDRVLLRNPGSHELWGVVVLDPDPPALTRRGDARRRAESLLPTTETPDPDDELRRRRFARISDLQRLGVDATSAPTDALRHGDWVVDRDAALELQHQLATLVADQEKAHPLDPGVTLASAARDLCLPSPEVVAALVSGPLRLEDGKVRAGTSGLPEGLTRSLEVLAEELRTHPFAAPDANRMEQLGLDVKAVAAASQAGRLLRLGDLVVLLPGADVDAAARLSQLPQPFTTSEARQHLGTTRRVALPLLAHLDRIGLTRRLADDRRTTHPCA